MLTIKQKLIFSGSLAFASMIGILLLGQYTSHHIRSILCR